MESNLALLAVAYVSLVFSLSVHEAAHAITADRCGDPSARLLGRVTLNPLKHMDLLGTVVMPLLMLGTGIPLLFGWAKPVPFNPVNLRDMRRDPVLIAVAGPLSNLLLAALFVFLTRAVTLAVGLENLPDALILLFVQIILINLTLAVFNLIPAPPLDGHYVVKYFLSSEAQRAFEQIGPFGILVAILLARPLFPILFPYFYAIVIFALG